MTSGVGAKVALGAGLYLVATPIGSARDITLRALDILASADVLAAEDTRTLRRLLEIHGIALGDRVLLPYHDHNGPTQRPRILQLLAEGKSVAYSSDAGTPMVADPGFALARDAVAAGFDVTGAPGPVAAIAALTLSGLPTDRFAFLGFLPNAKGARRAALQETADFPGTLVFYESPHRCSEMISDSAVVLGGDREAAVCRELTKRFEEIRRGSLNDLAAELDGKKLKGEIVVCIGRGTAAAPVDIEGLLRDALTRMSLKDAVKAVSEAHGLKRRDVYQTALSLEIEH